MADIERSATADNDRSTADEAELHLAARALIGTRMALRSDGLPKEILGDAPLDMLLALFVEDKATMPAAAEIAAATPAPPVVSQRWLAALKDLGLVEWHGEATWARVQLTREGRNKVATSLAIVVERYRHLIDDRRASPRS